MSRLSFDEKWALRNLQNASAELQQALSQIQWINDERVRLVECKSVLDEIVNKRLA